MVEKQAGKKTCFVICPIGAPGSDMRLWSDDVFENLIDPVATKYGYEAYRSIEDPKPGAITDYIVRHVHEADLVVADLSFLNPNVFYELALRHAQGKPFIHLSNDVGAIPFDVFGLSAVEIESGGFGAVDKTRRVLDDHFRAVEDGTAVFGNPVSRYHQQLRVNDEGTTQDKINQALIDAVTKLERTTRAWEAREFDQQALVTLLEESRLELEKRLRAPMHIKGEESAQRKPSTTLDTVLAALGRQFEDGSLKDVLANFERNARLANASDAEPAEILSSAKRASKK